MSQMTSTARVGARALSRPDSTAPRLRVVTGAPLRHGDAALGVVCAILLAAGLMALLVLNTALAQGSFTVQKLQSTSDQLADAQAALNQSLDASKSPANLATRAIAMGMGPAQSAAFLRLSDGKVIGVAKPATAGPGFTVVGTAPAAPVAAAKPASSPSAPPASSASAAAQPVTVAPARAAVKPTRAATAPSSTRPAKPAKR
ncbi:MAG: hypothetical protein H7270_01430 [Dermatophilaceae bacterium]|nr:hypothetical protein [Dermatophilaceae bacterium]